MFSLRFSLFRLLLVYDDLDNDVHILPKINSINGVVFFSLYCLYSLKFYFFFIEIFFVELFFLVAESFLSYFVLSTISSACGTWKANDTITAIGTASKTQKNHIIVQHSSMHINTTRGLTHRVFHMNTGTNNFSSDCCIIVYRIIIAKTHHRPVNIKADTPAGIAPKNGPRYGMISNNHANTDRVPFCGMLIQNNSNIRSHAYDANHMNRHRKSWLFNHLVIPEYAASILAREVAIWRKIYFNTYFIS